MDDGKFPKQLFFNGEIVCWERSAHKQNQKNEVKGLFEDLTSSSKYFCQWLGVWSKESGLLVEAGEKNACTENEKLKRKVQRDFEYKLYPLKD